MAARKYMDVQNQSLMDDVAGAEPKGQVSLAIDDDYLNKWGLHHLPSYCNAHSRQICNSFKDAGPLQYGSRSPLFMACRDRLAGVFDSLPAPEPTPTPTPTPHSRSGHDGAGAGRRPGVAMRRYRDADGVCLAGSTPVELASGRRVPISKLRRGIRVRTPLGPRKVALVVKTAVQGGRLCRIGSLAVTPWHPISLDGKSWTFPAHVAQETVGYAGTVYSIMLERDGSPRAHALGVGGVWGVTLGHGLTRGSDARAHAFFGDYDGVRERLLRLGVTRAGAWSGMGEQGWLAGSGVRGRSG